ncbi:MAG: extracellular solute-binding protein [Paenibacillus sp.]|nr:extracellular solute-binding protein [Paenibacillus sp.]
MNRSTKGLYCVLLWALVLAGCNIWTVKPAALLPEPITLRIAWWGGQLRNDTTIQVIKLYEQQNPHVQIEYEYTNFDEYWKKIASLAAGNALPDIIQMDISYLTQYVSLGLLENLDSYTKNGLIDVENIDKSKLSGGRLGGRLYGFNLGVNALFGYYDPEVFKQNGLELPGKEWTWDEFDRLGEALKELPLSKDNQIYLATMFTPEQFFGYYLRQHGSTLYAASGDSLGYEDDQLFVNYFGRMQRLAQDELLYSPDIWTSSISNPGLDPFNEGRALFGWGYSNQFVNTTRSYGKPLEIVPMPGPDSDKGLFLKPGMFFSVAKNSKYKEEAARFISFFVNNLEANKLLQGERGVPVSSLVNEQMRPLLNPEMAQVFEYVEWVETHSSPMDNPEPVGSSDVTAVLRELYDLLLFGKITPEAAASEFRKKADLILEQNKNTD